MKPLLQLALLFLFASGTAAADAFTLQSLPPPPAYSTPDPPPSLAPAAMEETAFASAAAPAFDYGRDGYIGTVYEMDGFAPDTSSTLPTSTVPEPATLALFASGLALAALRRRRA